MKWLNLSLSDPPVLRNAVIKMKNHTTIKTHGSNTYEVTERCLNYIMEPMILLFA